MEIAWDRIIIILIIVFLMHFLWKHGHGIYRSIVWFLHALATPFIEIGNILHNTSNDVFKLGIIALIFIGILGLISILKQ